MDFGAAALALGVLCVALERFIFRPTLKAPLYRFLVSLGLVLIIENLLTYAYNAHGHPDWPRPPGHGSLWL